VAPEGVRRASGLRMVAALVDMARRLVENPAMTGEETAKAFGQPRD
jgi:hypothetical protein